MNILTKRVQDRQVRESEIDDVGTVDSGACRLTIWRRSMQQAQPTFGLTRVCTRALY